MFDDLAGSNPIARPPPLDFSAPHPPTPAPAHGREMTGHPGHKAILPCRQREIGDFPWPTP